MRNIEKICQWLGIVKPEQMRNGSRHEDLKGDTVALAKLVMKEGEKPGKFLLPHGMILLGWWLRMFMEDNPYGIQNQSSFRIMELSVYLAQRLYSAIPSCDLLLAKSTTETFGKRDHSIR